MALPAPSSAYTGFFIKIGTTEANAKITEIALKLNADTEAVLKDRFYLDKLIPAAQKQANGSIVYGFIGACIVGSDNYYMHNLNRIGAFRPPMLGADYISYADAGLNTLGLAGNSNVALFYSNFLTASLSPKSAWYVNTDMFGWEVKLTSQTWGQARVFNSGRAFPQQQQLANRYYLSRILGFGTGQQVNIRPFLRNGEGTNYGNVTTVTLGTQIDQILTEKRTAACTPGSNAVLLMTQATRTFLATFDSPNDQATGHFVWDGTDPDEPFNTQNGQLIIAGAGWYAYLTDDNTKMVEVNALGEIRRTQICIPPTPTLGVLGFLQDPVTLEAELVYQVSQTHTSQITVTGQIQEYLNGSPMGSPQNLEVRVAANSTTPTWIIKPSTVHQYGGKWRFQNVGLSPAAAGIVKTIDEF